jgi:hypothetical protein
VRQSWQILTGRALRARALVQGYLQLNLKIKSLRGTTKTFTDWQGTSIDTHPSGDLIGGGRGRLTTALPVVEILDDGNHSNHKVFLKNKMLALRRPRALAQLTQVLPEHIQTRSLFHCCS